MEKHIKVEDLKPGMLLVRSGKRAFNATVDAVNAVKPGTPAVGPRGGRYALTAHGASVLLSVHAGAHKPLLAKSATAVILVTEEY